MHRKEAREIVENYELIKALAEGEIIQYYSHGSWHDTTSPTFHPDYRYRVKPPEPREFWLNIYIDGGSYVHMSEESAKNASRLNTGCGFIERVHVREVVDEETE